MVDTKYQDRITTIQHMNVGSFGLISNEAIGGRHLVFRCQRNGGTEVSQLAIVFGALGRTNEDIAPYIVRADADYWGDETVLEVSNLLLQTDLTKIRMSGSGFGRRDHLGAVFQTNELSYFQTLGVGVGNSGPLVSLTGEVLENSLHGPTVASLNWSLVRNSEYEKLTGMDPIFRWPLKN